MSALEFLAKVNIGVGALRTECVRLGIAVDAD